MKQHTYGVTGMHCASCEALIEKRVKRIDGVVDARADMARGTLTISFRKSRPGLLELDRLFPEGLYRFSETRATPSQWPDALRASAYALSVTAVFFGLSASGRLPSLAIARGSSYGAFFAFGLVAGLSTCAALVGGLVLALSTQWSTRTGESAAFIDRLVPQLRFHIGRIGAYALSGAMLGLLGGSVRPSPEFTSAMVVSISLLMLIIALQMLGFSPLHALRLALPKPIVDKVGSGIATGGLIRPFPTGLATILLPCGFTIAAEGAAVLSGSPWRGMSIMAAFVLGTMPPLLAIGLSGSALSSRPATSRIFTRTAGLLVIVFTLFNLNSQFGFAGRIGEQNARPATPASAAAMRIVRTTAVNGLLATEKFDLRAGEQVRFIVDPKDNGSGCMNAIMIPGLWSQPQYLTKGKPVIMQFTPQKRGTYRITCAMGMPWGIITVK